MIFENDGVLFNILDVLEIDQKNVNMCNSARNFGALSFRFHADTHLKAEDKDCHVCDNGVVYVPPRLDYNRVAKYDHLIVIHFEAINYYTKEIEWFTAKEPVVFSTLFREALEVWEKKEVGYKSKCSALLYEIFHECYRQTYRSGTTDSKIQKSVDYLHAHYREADLSIQTVAEQSYMSEVYFRKLFKQEFSVSPQKYIVNLRIQYAVGLISTGYYSLKEVAYLSGYTDYKYFSVEFKKKMGISPSQYSYYQ